MLSFAAAPNYEDPADVASSDPANAAANNEYLVTVRASDGTESTESTLVVQVTDASEQPAKPDRPAVSPTAGSTTSLDVSWTAPDLDGGPDIVGYELQYREAEDGAWNDWTHDGTGTSTAITGLTPGTEYQVRGAGAQRRDAERLVGRLGRREPRQLRQPRPDVPPPGPLTRRVAENSPTGAAVGDPVTATDTDTGDTLSYTLEGEDASSFDIGAATGQITTRAEVSYDHEASPSYSVTVKADDGNGGAASVAVAILNDDLTYRVIHMDGRELEADPFPSWMGYSVGRWDGDTLVVDSAGFNDKTWVSRYGVLAHGGAADHRALPASRLRPPAGGGHLHRSRCVREAVGLYGEHWYWRPIRTCSRRSANGAAKTGRAASRTPPIGQYPCRPTCWHDTSASTAGYTGETSGRTRCRSPAAN